MIRKEDVYRIGTLGKPHGVKGEINFHFTDDIFDRTEECDYLVCMMDGILVPFFMDEYRFKNDSIALVKFDGIETTEAARKMTGVEVFFPIRYAEECEELSWSYFVGFKVVDECRGDLGTVEEVDETTINTLFVIRQSDGDELLVPAQEAFIVEIDHKQRVISMNLPEGMVE